MTADLLLRLEQASFGYGDRPVLTGIDLEVRAGEFAVVVGANGSGKSTLLKGLLGLVPPASGKLTRRVQQVAYVPQRESLDPVFPLSVAEVVSMGAFGRLRFARGLTREDWSRVQDSLKRVGLAERGRDQYCALSGGQRQRVLLARALVTNAKLFLLDEPTAGVDEAAKLVVLNLLHKLSRDEGVAVLLVTHDVESLSNWDCAVLSIDAGQVKRAAMSDFIAASSAART